MLKLEHDTILSDEHLRILKAVLLHSIHYYKLNLNKKKQCVKKILLRLGIVDLRNRVMKPSYAKWRQTSNY